MPVAVETLGSWGTIGHNFIKDLGKLIRANTKEPKSTSYIFQEISIAIQKGNVQCIQNTFGDSAFEELEEIYYTSQANTS